MHWTSCLQMPACPAPSSASCETEEPELQLRSRGRSSGPQRHPESPGASSGFTLRCERAQKVNLPLPPRGARGAQGGRSGDPEPLPGALPGRGESGSPLPAPASRHWKSFRTSSQVCTPSLRVDPKTATRSRQRKPTRQVRAPMARPRLRPQRSPCARAARPPGGRRAAPGAADGAASRSDAGSTCEPRFPRPPAETLEFPGGALPGVAPRPGRAEAAQEKSRGERRAPGPGHSHSRRRHRSRRCQPGPRRPPSAAGSPAPGTPRGQATPPPASLRAG